MGQVLETRLLDAGHDLAVYNRTREKASPLAEGGATVVDTPAELADRDVVFTMVAGSADVARLVQQNKPGDKIKVEVERLGQRQEFDITLVNTSVDGVCQQLVRLVTA